MVFVPVASIYSVFATVGDGVDDWREVNRGCSECGCRAEAERMAAGWSSRSILLLPTRSMQGAPHARGTSNIPTDGEVRTQVQKYILNH